MRSAALPAILLTLGQLVGAQESRLATLYADKINCSACAAVITKALRKVAGVSDVRVDVEKKEVLVQFDSSQTSVEDLVAATARKGFPSSVRKVEP